MKLFVRLVSLILVTVMSMTYVVLPVAAQSVTASFVLSPRTRSVPLNGTFDVSITMRATAPKQVSYARVVLFFDPTSLEIADDLQAGSLFCNYPVDQSNYIADNEQGQIVITGISTGQAGCSFPELTTTEVVFAKVTFKAKKNGSTNVSFMYNGRLEDEMSAITDTNSPPQMIMSAPQNGTYAIGSSATTPPPPPDNLGVDPRILIGVAATTMVLGWYLLPRKGKSQRVVTSTEAW